jgi:mRNA-degrading endonuclease RelE of RelBE toxin-antitoxin system
VVIIETPTFTRQVTQLLDPESYRLLQLELVDDPSKGTLIRESGGLRKMRWQAPGRGKRGGVRVIYYWAVRHDLIVLLLMYPKGKQDDLTPQQRKILRRIVEEELK